MNFTIFTQIVGTVFNTELTKGFINKDSGEVGKDSFHLVFVGIENEKTRTVKVKVKDCNNLNDIKQFNGKEVSINNLQVFNMNNNTYYACETKDIELKKQNK